MVDVAAKKIEFVADFNALVNSPSIAGVVTLQQKVTEESVKAIDTLFTGGNITEISEMIAFTTLANKTLAGWANINFSKEDYKEIYNRLETAINNENKNL